MRQHVFAFLVALVVWTAASVTLAPFNGRVYAQSPSGGTTSGLDFSCNRVAELVREVERSCDDSGGFCTGKCVADFVTYGYCGLPLQSQYECREYTTARPVWREETNCVWRNGVCTCGEDWTYVKTVGSQVRWWCDRP